MKLNSFQFPDRSRVETFSQKQQQLIVNQQTPAVPPNQVTGTTGQPFVAISPQSMTISTNGATDLVGGQVLMALSMQNLQAAAVQPDNTYVAMLSPDRQSWMIQETMRTVNTYAASFPYQNIKANIHKHRYDRSHGQAKPAGWRVHDPRSPDR
jgi:cystathionine beta-lyase/cystathionine gamma-synthase